MTNSSCPRCGHELPDLVDETGVNTWVWLFNGKFYCGEACARAASGAIT